MEFNDFSRIVDQFLDAKSDGYRLENGIQDNMLQFCYENRAQDVPKMLQDTPILPRTPYGALEIPPRHPQETPRRAQDASQGAPKTL